VLGILEEKWLAVRCFEATVPDAGWEAWRTWVASQSFQRPMKPGFLAEQVVPAGACKKALSGLQVGRRFKGVDRKATGRAAQGVKPGKQRVLCRTKSDRL
jgi:hypothetical protein